MITVDEYFQGRRQTYAAELTPQIEANAVVIVKRAVALLDAFYAAIPGAAPRHVNSGWRPPTLNQRIPGAAQKSLHMTAEAIDLSDDDGALDDWINSPNGELVLQRLELWAENWRYTSRWTHVQSRPPRSGRRFFTP